MEEATSVTIKKNSLWKYSAFIVLIVLAVGMFVFGNASGGTADNGATGKVVNGDNTDTQKITLSTKNYNYYPNTITVKAGKPVSITLDSSVRGCLRSFAINDLGVRAYSQSPSQTIDFTPTQKGRANLFSEMASILSDFNPVIYRDPEESYFHGELLPLDIGTGQVIFIRKSLKIFENGGFRSHEDSPYHKEGDMVSGRCQWVKMYSDKIGQITVLNMHGLWQRNSKKADTPERLEQSEKVNGFFENIEGKRILCGDFNLAPHGEAMRKFEDNMLNLVKEYKVNSTRSSHYPKEEKFADYILVSKDVKVMDFKVLQDEVSDHLPLLVEF